MPMRLFAALMLGSVAACGGPEDRGDGGPTLYFSAIPDQNSTELKEKFGRVADHLTLQLGVKVEYRAASDYEASYQMFRTGDIHFAWFGGLTGCQARAAVPGARAIAQGDTDPKFFSYFIAHKDTGLERSEQFPAALAELTFAFGDPKSTSGRLMPEYFIRKFTGKGPQEFFRRPYVFSGSHDKTWEMVQGGQVQAGVLNYAVYDKQVAAGRIDPDLCRIVWKTPTYADYNWTAHPNVEKVLGAGGIHRLQEALLALPKELLQVFPRERLIPATNADFEGIAEVARELNLLR